MLHRFKPLIIIICCIIFSLWWLGLNNETATERLYPKEEYAQDISKIYFDLGKISQARGDVIAAIHAYSNALHHKPDFQEAYYLLGTCYQKQGDLGAAQKMYDFAQKYAAVS